MKVTPIAYTALVPSAAPEGPPFTTDEWFPRGDDDDDYYEGSDADRLAEFAGRACYQSWGRPNPKTATNKGYLANIIGQGHESVLEHASVTFYVEGVSRSLTHELIRHRHLSFSELSQRYVNARDARFVVPPAIREAALVDDAEKVWNNNDGADLVRRNYQELVDILTYQGYKRKQAREAARAVLPNATETKIVVTGNIRAWRDVLKKRHCVAADREIQEFARRVLDNLRSIAPNSVQDIPNEPYE